MIRSPTIRIKSKKGKNSITNFQINEENIQKHSSINFDYSLSERKKYNQSSLYNPNPKASKSFYKNISKKFYLENSILTKKYEITISYKF